VSSRKITKARLTVSDDDEAGYAENSDDEYEDDAPELGRGDMGA
jgi:hypothetical protein